MIEIILAGLSVALGVANLVREQQSTSAQAEGALQIRRIDRRLSALQRQVQEQSFNSTNMESFRQSYEALIDALRSSRIHSQYLEFIPTDYGTYRLVRRSTRAPKSQRSFLRDSKGDY